MTTYKGFYPMTFRYVDSINKLCLFNIAINQDFQADPTPNQYFVIYEGPLRNVLKHVVAQTFLLILIFPLFCDWLERRANCNSVR